MHTLLADHPLVKHKLTLLRDAETDTATFRTLADELVTLLAYEATREVRVAVSYALANPQYGAGGMRQVFLHTMQEHLDEGTLEVVERIQLADTLSGLGARTGAHEVQTP